MQIEFDPGAIDDLKKLEVSQDWHTHVSYAADGTVVETVILEAAKLGAWPLEVQPAAA